MPKSSLTTYLLLLACITIFTLTVIEFNPHQRLHDDDAVGVVTTATKTTLQPTTTTTNTAEQHQHVNRFAIVTIASKVPPSGNAFASQSKSAQFVNATMYAALKNKLLYMSLHQGYDLILGGDTSCNKNGGGGGRYNHNHHHLHPSFGKFHIVAKLLKEEQYEWILVVDHDAIFAQLETSIETLLRSKIFQQQQSGSINDFSPIIFSDHYDETAHSKDFIVAKDWNGINTGVMLIRGKRSNWARVFFSKTLLNPPRECKHGGAFYEQSVLKCILDSPNSAPDRWKIEFVSPQRVLNAYPPPYHFDREESKFEQGRDFIAHFAGASGLATTNSEKYPIEKAIEKFHDICKESSLKAHRPSSSNYVDTFLQNNNNVTNFRFGDEGVFSFVNGRIVFDKKNVC